MKRWPASRIALGAAVLLALSLRLIGLGAGLRHRPHIDERYFVENVGLMLARGDLDHRFYEYPGLFFYILCPVLAFAGFSGPTPYLAARALVAAFGTLNVLLLHRLGRRVAGAPAALLAAGLVAVSPVDVETSHMVRVDPVLASLVLLALSAFRRLDGTLASDARAGLGLGAAVAVKFTGGLLLPSYLAHRWLTPHKRLRGGLVAGLVALAAFVVLSPYAVIHAREFVEGVTTQLSYHYQQRPHGRASPGAMLLSYAAVWPKALGLPATALAAAGLAIALRQWRHWVGLLALPAATLAVLATSEYHFDRHMLPSLGVIALLAGVALERLARARPRMAAAVAVLALAFPLWASVRYLRQISAPGTRDVALDWIQAHVPAGARILTTIPGLGLDRRRFEVVEVQRLNRRVRALALDGDVIVTSGVAAEGPFKDLRTAVVIRPRSRFAGRTVRVRLVAAADRPAYQPVPLDRARLAASQNGALLEALRDGDAASWWTAAPRPGRQEWVEVRLPQPVRLARVELLLDGQAGRAGRGLRLVGSLDGVQWAPLPAFPVRPAPGEQRPPASQAFLLEPVDVRGLRVLQRGRPARLWGIAELRLSALPSPVSPGAK